MTKMHNSPAARTRRASSKNNELTNHPWRVTIEQSSGTNNWVYKFKIDDTKGEWVEIPGKIRSAFRTFGGTVQLIQEVHGLNGKRWRMVLQQLGKAKPLSVSGVFEGQIFCKEGRLHFRSTWLTDSEAAVLTQIDDAGFKDSLASVAHRAKRSQS